MAVPSRPIRPEGITLYRCANWRDGGPACDNTGHMPCETCHLVMYCSEACMEAHGDIHVDDCQHGLAQGTWTTKWLAEHRNPVFVKVGDHYHPFFRRMPRDEYTWGNSPGVDLLNLNFNEGIDTERHFRILSVEGDIRNVVQTTVRLPDSFVGEVTFTIGNGSMEMTARNIIFLIIAFLVPDKKAAVDCMVHLWSSAYLKPSHAQLLTEYIRPHVVEAAQISASQSQADVVFTQTLVADGHGVRISLTAADWEQLVGYFEFPEEDDMVQPHSVIARNEVMANVAFEDERDLILLRNAPYCRVAITRFWRDGVLLPFAQNCSYFTVPNPFYYHGPEYVVEELADPLEGVDIQAALNHASDMPRSDQYGRLFAYLVQHFSTFVKNANEHNVVFEVNSLEPRSLHLGLDRGSFARIDVTAASERSELELEEVFELYGPKLEHPEDNPLATMIGMYVDGVEDELLRHKDLAPTDAQREAVGRLLNLDPEAMNEPYTEEMVRCQDALPFVLDVEEAFNRWTFTSGFTEHLINNTMRLKTENTIVKEWPTRTNLVGNEPSDHAKLRFAQCVASPFGGTERLVEIRRVTEAEVRAAEDEADDPVSDDDLVSDDDVPVDDVPVDDDESMKE